MLLFKRGVPALCPVCLPREHELEWSISSRGACACVCVVLCVCMHVMYGVWCVCGMCAYVMYGVWPVMCVCVW